MHRFRKKSDVKRGQLPEPVRTATLQAPPRRPPPALPAPDDFRTSLILPDLTRRFSLLQKQSGDPALVGLREGFAEQRARGGPNQITEEEEHVVMETLVRMRAGYANGSGRIEVEDDDEEEGDDVGALRQARRETDNESDYPSSPTTRGGRYSARTSTSSAPRSPGGARNIRPAKRYSNNLFGSGAFRDQSYMRSAGHHIPRQTSSRSVLSQSSADSQNLGPASVYSDSLSALTPEHTGIYGSIPSSPSSSMGSRDDLSKPSTRPRYQLTNSAGTAVATRLSNTFAPSALKRVSMSLDEVLSRLEEAGEDEVLVPRTAPPSKAITTEARQSSSSSPSESSSASSSPQPPPPQSQFEAGTALSADRPISADGEEAMSVSVPALRPGTTSPTPRLPGYIPGMPRPMTPRNHEPAEELRSHSTTPRAASPPAAGTPPSMPPSFASSMLQRGSAGLPTSPLGESTSVTTPGFLSRSTSGRHTPDADASFVDFGSPTSTVSQSYLTGRPTSPLSPTPQPIRPPSRPTTPSNITWSPQPKSHVRNGSQSSIYGHSRNGSWASVNGGARASSDIHGSSYYDRNRPTAVTRVRSPVLPGSSQPDASPSNAHIGASIQRPLSAKSQIESLSGSPYRTATPTRQLSPLAATFAERMGTPGGHASSGSNSSLPFSLALGSPHARVFSPSMNSSRSSLASDGSSYHSYEAEPRKDRLGGLLVGLGVEGRMWHHLPDAAASVESLAGGAEDVVREYAAMTRTDFEGIQEKLVDAAKGKSTVLEMPQKMASLRRRKPSVSRSIQSIGEKEMFTSAEERERQMADMAQQEKIMKANLLLETMIASVQSPLTPASPGTLPEPPLAPAPIVAIRPELEPEPESEPEPEPEQMQEPIFESEPDVIVHSATEENVASGPPSTPQLSSPERRNLALANLLDSLPTLPSSPVIVEPAPEPELVQHPSMSLATPARTPSPVPSPTASQEFRHHSPSLSPSLPAHRLSPSSRSTSPSHAAALTMDPVELAKDVQRRAEAATAALRKTPSFTNLPETSSSHRRKITVGQISSPKLEYASNHIEAQPLNSPASPQQSGSKIGRMWKLRGTMRGKQQHPAGDEVTPFPAHIKPSPSPAPSTGHYEQFPSSSALGPPGPKSATEPNGKFKAAPVPSPPASAGPGLKGFMARFRKSSKVVNTSPELEKEQRQATVHTSQAAASVSKASPPTAERTPQLRQTPLFDGSLHSTNTGEYTHSSFNTPQVSLSPSTAPTQSSLHSPPETPQQSIISSLPSTKPQSQQSSLLASTPKLEPTSDLPHPGTETPPTMDEQARKQLFDAASILGLDQQALSDLVRSTSMSSRATGFTASTRQLSTAISAKTRSSGRPTLNGDALDALRSPARSAFEPNAPWSANATDGYPSPEPLSPRPTPIGQTRPSVDMMRTAGPSEGRPSMENFRPVEDAPVARKPSIKPSPAESFQDAPVARKMSLKTSPTEPGARSRPGEAGARSTIVRRTLIFPSDPRFSTMDMNALLQRAPTSKKQRRASAQSHMSGRSLIDRAPTPPPPRAGGSKRFSHDASPPVPRLPTSVSGLGAAPSIPSHPSGTNESLYDMYGDQNENPSRVSFVNRPVDSESRPAIEVIEMANGETVWSIVNGLREEEEDYYGDRRASFDSEYSSTYSPAGGESSEGVQLFFKEHARHGSKGSAHSFGSRKGKKLQNPALRPETKVFYSSSTQISRLIETLTRGMDSGSFNLMPQAPSTRVQSATTMSHHSQESEAWAIENLDKVIGKRGAA